MKTLTIVLIPFVLAMCCLAQNAPIPTKTFNFNAAPISLPGARGTFVGTDAGVLFTPTQNFGLGETNILSSDGRLAFFGGGAEYSFGVLSKYINNHTNVSGFRIRIGARAYAGVDRVKDAAGVVAQHWGGLAQGTFAYSLDTGGSWQMGANIGMARFPGYAKGWEPVVELGPSFHF
jgi:hypothetical protein